MMTYPKELKDASISARIETEPAPRTRPDVGHMAAKIHYVAQTRKNYKNFSLVEDLSTK